MEEEKRSPEEEKEGYGGKDLQKRKVLSLVSSIILVSGISVSGIEVCDVGCWCRRGVGASQESAGEDARQPADGQGSTRRARYGIDSFL